jgi:hypothetical protein
MLIYLRVDVFRETIGDHLIRGTVHDFDNSTLYKLGDVKISNIYVLRPTSEFLSSVDDKNSCLIVLQEETGLSLVKTKIT